jgi:uncharacterized protein (TIGR03083 family)
MVTSAPDATIAVPASEWTVGDVAAHVALGIEAYARYATGNNEPFVDVSDIAGGSLTRTSAARLQDEHERDLSALAARVRDALASLLQATDGRGTDEVVLWNGQEIGLGAMLGMGVGELLLHGRDVAKALGRPWDISADDARLVLTSALPILPLLVNPETTRDVRATYDIRVRGGARVCLAIDNGGMTIEQQPASVDCHVSADPIELLLVAYGRKTQWVPILTGKMVAWGRKPWLGPRLVSYLVTP